MFTVKTVSGFEMILEDAGHDADGNQLWRQVKVSIGGRGLYEDLTIRDPSQSKAQARIIGGMPS